MSKEYFMKHNPRNYEYSYETTATPPISKEEYEICVVVPQSKKYLAYITTTTCGNTPYLIIYELNRYRKISGVSSFSKAHPSFEEMIHFSGETIFYGSIVEQFFIVEDILLYKNSKCHNTIFKEKMQNMILSISLSRCFTPLQHIFTLPFMFSNTEEDMKSFKEKVPYPIHSIQYRSLYSIKPILNLKDKCRFDTKNHSTMTTVPPSTGEFRQSSPPLRKLTPQYSKPQYRTTAIFQVRADLQFDIYSLYCYNGLWKMSKNRERYTFVDYAHIPDYRTSRLMNSLFRNIRENQYLDLIEESYPQLFRILNFFLFGLPRKRYSQLIPVFWLRCPAHSQLFLLNFY